MDAPVVVVAETALLMLLLLEPIPIPPPPPPPSLCASVLLRNENRGLVEVTLLLLPEVVEVDPEVEDEKCDAEEWVWLVMAVSSRLSRRIVEAAPPANGGWLLQLLLVLLLPLRPPPRDGSKTRRRCLFASNDGNGGLLYDGIDVMALLLVLVDDVPSAIGSGSGPALLTLFSLNDADAAAADDDDDDDSPII
jgi:hypothetical protein